MSHLPLSVLHRLREQHGVISSEQLTAAGLSRWRIGSAVASGTLGRVHEGVYRITSAPETLLSRCAAACAADPCVVISGLTAAAIWDFKHARRGAVAIVASCPHDTSPVSRGVKLRRTNTMQAIDVVERNDGIRLTSPPRTWFDVARDLDDDRFEELTEHVIDRHVGVEVLWRTASRLRARGRAGSKRVGEVLARRAAWQKPAGSNLEFGVLRALARRGIELERQFALNLPNGMTIHLDGADPVHRFGVEVDHVTWHGGRFDAQRDKVRDRQARKVGWVVERVTDQECRDDFNGAIDEIATMYALVNPSFRPHRLIS